MTIRRFGPVGALLAVFAAPLGAGPAPITIEVDAREAPRRIFHARMWIPLPAGPATLLYPEWLPGEHSPTGPIADVAGLRFEAAGRPVAWKRDPVSMYAFHLEMPEGAETLDVALDYLSPAGAEGFTSGPSSTPELAVISWNQLLLYPKRHRARRARLRREL